MANTHFKCAICANATAMERDGKLKCAICVNTTDMERDGSSFIGMFFFAVFVSKVAKVVVLQL